MTMPESKPAPFIKRDAYPSADLQNLVLKFHRAFGAPAADMPTMLNDDRGHLRVDMIQEELDELHEAVENQDFVQQYDALLDILVLAFGGLVEMGLDAYPGFAEVMRANMSKLDADGKPILSRGMELDGFPEGKILKGPRYEAPDLFLMLIAQGWTPALEDYDIEQMRVRALQSGLVKFESKQEIVDHLTEHAPGVVTPGTGTVLKKVDGAEEITARMSQMQLQKNLDATINQLPADPEKTVKPAMKPMPGKNTVKPQ